VLETKNLPEVRQDVGLGGAGCVFK
jgi:hypothetical protein